MYHQQIFATKPPRMCPRPGLFVSVHAKWNQVLFEEASKDARQPRAVRIALLTPPSSAGVEQRRTGTPKVRRQIVCLFFSVSVHGHTPPPRSNSVDMSSRCTETSTDCCIEETGLCMLGWPWGSFCFHQWGQSLSKGLLLPSSLSAIHHWWWMGNGEAVAFSFTALYHFW